MGREFLAQNKDFLYRFNEIGIALSSEHNLDKLMELIVKKALDISHADSGVLFVHDEKNKTLKPSVWICNSKNIYTGGTTGVSIDSDDIDLYNEDGSPHYESVAAHAALIKKSINISDIYEDEHDFSSTKIFDIKGGYKTKSILVVPLLNKRQEIIGSLRLSNAQDENGEIVDFSDEAQHFVECLASMAAVAIDNDMLICGLEDLLDSFIQLMAKAIDRKSPHTGNHLQKVPVITTMLTKAACEQQEGVFKDFSLNEEEMYEVHIAAWLHDCGKLSTPDYVLEKSKKLETFYDRIELIRTRLEVLKRDAEIAYLKSIIDKTDNEPNLKDIYNARVEQVQKDWEFVMRLNEGAEWVDDSMIEKLNIIAEKKWTCSIGVEEERLESFFTESELECLSVRKGTLTDKERHVIMEHIVHSIEMLNELPFPKQLQRVPEYAGGHHEKINGKGYPKGLTGDEMSIPARIMAVADVFEALTSHDRPYKKNKTLTEIYKIMKFMCDNGELDKDIVDLLWKGGVYKDYAAKYLLEEQCDDVLKVINDDK